MTQESNEDWLERQYKKRGIDEVNEYAKNKLLAIIADRLTALNFIVSELNDNLRNINHNIYELDHKKK